MIKIYGSELKRALSFVGKLLVRNTVADFQKYVLIEAKDGKASFVYFDGSMEVVCNVDTESKEEFKVATELEKLVSRASITNDGDLVTIKEKDAKVIFSVGRSKMTLSMMPASDYPAFSLNEQGVVISADFSEFREAVNKVKNASGSNDPRRYLNGMCFDVVDRNLTLICSDGHRMSYSGLNAVIDSESQFSVVMPREVFPVVTSVADSGDVQIFITQSKIIVNGNLGTLKTPLIEGRFPNWRAIAKIKEDHYVTYNAASLKNAIRSAMITTPKKETFGAAIDFSVGKDSTQITSFEGAGKPTSTQEIIDSNSKSEFDFTINGKYLTSAIQNIEGGNIDICYGKAPNGANAILVKEGDFCSIIMTVKR